MAFSFKPRLGGENSIIVALAVGAFVVGMYNYALGPLSDAHQTGANDPNMNAALKKAGWKSVVAVAGLTLLAQDPNILILGGSAIIAEELSYRHAIMANPQNGQIEVTASDYLPAGAAPPVNAAAAPYAGVLEAVPG